MPNTARTGHELESIIAQVLIERGYHFYGRNNAGRSAYEQARFAGTLVPGFVWSYREIAASLGGKGQRNADFLIVHPALRTLFGSPEVIVEAKAQEEGGSADDKVPGLIMNIWETYPLPTIIVHSLDGFRAGLFDWAREAAARGGQLRMVLSLDEFARRTDLFPPVR